jgi:hypothetical protein
VVSWRAALVTGALVTAALVGTAPYAVAAERPPEFVGVATLGGETLLAFQSASATPALWCRVDEHVGSYRVIEYDRAAGRVTLLAGDERVVVALREAHVVALPPLALAAPEGQRLVRAAFQALFDTGQASVVTDAEGRAVTVALASDGGVHFVDAAVRPLVDDPALPVHIVVPADMGLEEIARRVRQPVAKLAALNPAFESRGDSSVKHTVRVR